MGAAAGESALGARAFTLEGWVRRDGASWGATASTGTGGVTAVPLITKGRGEAENSNVDMNYFLGVTAGGVPVADFEQLTQGAGGWNAGQNHPACSSAAIADQLWHHVAVTYSAADGWRFYIDGVEGTAADGTTCTTCSPAGSCPRSPGVEPRYDCIQHFALGTAMNSTGVSSGLFAGMIDEARVWNRALSAGEVSSSMSLALTSGSGLIGRWGFDDGATASDSTSPAENGTMVGGPAFDPNDKAPLGTGVCSYVPVSCDDANFCTADICDAGTGCSHAPANDGSACNDGNACTVSDVCSAGVCTGTPGGTCCLTDPDCDDGNTCTSNQCVESNSGAVSLDGVDDYVTMGAVSGLNAVQFTVETWFLWTGGGVSTTTGSGGVDLYPLVTKGAPEADGSSVDENYILGVRSTGNAVLAADFEEGAAGASPGLNHPIAGTITITQNAWHHAAVTYDGSCWKLYLDGVEEALSGTACPNQPVRSDSVQHTGIGAALESDGTRNGAFHGAIDEARVWNHVRSAAQIQSDMSRQIETAPGLLGRWGMNEGSGATASDTAGGHTGFLTGGAAWRTSGLQDFGEGTCRFEPLTGTSCEDGDLCTSDETCNAGVCVAGGPTDCSDGNVCTDDDCDAELGCFHSNNAIACDDGSACTTSDVCEEGSCSGGLPLICNDGDACTADACVPASGCSFTSVSCDDGNFCTVDACAPATGCASTPIPGCCTADQDCNDGHACTLDFCPASSNVSALSLDGVDDYVTMGTASGLGTQRFTLEGWVRRTGAGATTTTGTGGIAALVPILSKGRGEAETPANLNTNYVMGLSGNRLAADFEDKVSGLNHPVCGSTTIPTDGTWHHVAASYDGTCWALYVDGVAETLSTTCSTCTGGACTVCPGATPEDTSIQHFGIGTAMTSAGTAAGFFLGTIDEVRVWNRALPLTEIQSRMNRETTAGTGLIGRWGLNEGSGATAADSTAPAENGVLTNGATWAVTPLPPVGTDTCEHTSVTDGTSCSDGSLCTPTDTCQAGVCSGANPVVCTPSDACHVAGTCDPGTGVCSNPAAPDGAGCDDGNVCTAGETCTGGVCGGGAPPPDLCDGADNDCNPATADGSAEAWYRTLCDGTDGDLCMEGTYACPAGLQVCTDMTSNSVESCNGADDDCDGAVDDGYDVGSPCVLMPGTCAPQAANHCAEDGSGVVCENEPLVSVEHSGGSGALVSWLAVPGAPAYDVVRGDLQTLAATGGDFTPATQLCLTNDTGSTSVLDTDVPLAGQGFWYLMRASGCTGGSSYEDGAASQVGQRDAEITSSGSDCP
jgi:hypothetical protein